MSDRIIPVIMSGGSGTRLWPLSTASMPKQFHALCTTKTMIQETILRLSASIFQEPIVICGESHVEHVISQLQAISTRPQAIVLEPVARNTAAVAAVAALTVQSLDPDALVLLCPADHIIANTEQYQIDIASATGIARQRIVTFGIEPTKPETGFGYIERGELLDDNAFAVGRFLEKPDMLTAQSYVNSGRHHWNAGIFLFSPKIMLEELQVHAPDVLVAVKDSLAAARREANIIYLDECEFAKCPSISIDYAVMENTSRSAVVPCNIGWADVGNFSELHHLGQKDEAGNHSFGATIILDSKDCLVRSEEIPVAIIGMKDIMVIATKEGILVAPLNRAQDVKRAADAAKALA